VSAIPSRVSEKLSEQMLADQRGVPEANVTYKIELL
jgi:hypothetical protein